MFMKLIAEEFDPQKITVGVIGFGLLGSSMVTCLLLAGHSVIAIAPMPIDLETGESKILKDLEAAFLEGFSKKKPNELLENLTITADYNKLESCQIIIESVIENKEIKIEVYKICEKIIASDAILATNTSAIPISELQENLQYPERFLGLHMMIPVHTAKFLEIICGEKTDPQIAEYLYKVTPKWNKEPSLLRKDIRGFITNRLMYSMYREGCYLVENGYATVEDVDRAIRNSAGYWLAHAGIFRWMDMTGIPAYHTVMKELLPTLSNQTTIPKLIDDIVKEGGNGVFNGQGFYEYTPEQAKIWQESYQAFAFEMSKLGDKYPADLGGD
jgi:3-hydroxybutyryl-CoA dehydrogenase